MASELTKIPGVGTKIAAVLEALGVSSIADLRGQNPMELYERDCLYKGYRDDRCVLYVFRLAVYFAEHDVYEEEKLKWWYWKDHPYPGEKKTENL